MKAARMAERLGEAFSRAAAYLVMGTFALMTIYPIFWLFMNSFKFTREFQMSRLALPKAPTIMNYVMAWKLGGFSQLILNSILYTVGSTAAIIVLSVMAGFAFAKLKSRATKWMYGGFVLGILLTLESLMIPIFLQMTELHLYNSRLAVFIVYVGAGLPIGIFLCTEYIRGIPSALIESARIDGAGYFLIFRRVILPLTRPVATTLAILDITSIWNEFCLINILVSKTELKSMPLGILKFSGALSSDFGKEFAALCIGMLPMLVFYLVFRKWITRGVAAGAVKG
jgi:raffinose/stachyose/melibiose transport system permease protein